MKEQDDVLTDIIRQMQVEKGQTGGYDESRFSERVEVLGPSVSLETIRESITAECLESLGVSWDETYGLLLAFVEREGHCRVLANYRTSNGYQLGTWVIAQRFKKDRLPPDRIAQLETVHGWTWDPHEDAWEIGFNSLRSYIEREGHGLVPYMYLTTDKYRLGQWVVAQRAQRDLIPRDRATRMEALPGWVWDVGAEQWEKGFCYLTDFVKREGHSNVLQISDSRRISTR